MNFENSNFTILTHVDYGWYGEVTRWFYQLFYRALRPKVIPDTAL